MNLKFISILFAVLLLFAGTNLNAQCIKPASATVSTTTSTCLNNGSITINNVTGGSIDSSGTAPLVEYSIVTSSNPSQPLVGWQNANIFNNLYPGTYTVAIRYNCNASTTGYSDSLTKSATITGNYQSMTVTFSGIVTSFCNNGDFTVNATKGYTGVSGSYTYQLVSAQNATQPDPSAVTPVQSSNVFANLASGNYYVRVFDDCGNFVTYSVTVPAGTVVNPFINAPNCSSQSANVFTENKYGCNDSTKYYMNPMTFTDGVSFSSSNVSFPAKLFLFYPDGSSDSITLTDLFDLDNLYNNYSKDISSFITANQFGSFYVQMKDNCGNVFTSFKANFTPPVSIGTYASTEQTCSTIGVMYSQALTNSSCRPCPVSNGNNTYTMQPSFNWYAAYSTSIDNGATWHSNTDTIFTNCSATTQILTPEFAVCGDTIISCNNTLIFPCQFSFLPIEMNNFACIGNSGIYINVNSSSPVAQTKLTFISVPAGQAPIPTITGGGLNYYYGNNGGDYTYTGNLLPGKYVYTVTDTICGTVFEDSITLSHPHQYSESQTVQQTCTGGAVTVSLTNNPYFPQVVGGGSDIYDTRNKYLFKILNSAGSVLQTITMPATSGSLPDNGSTTTTTAVFNNLASGTYTIQIWHDSSAGRYIPNACGPLTDSVTITQTALSISSSVFLNCNGTSGSIAVNTTGGVPPYTYELYNGTTVSPANLVTSQSSPLFTGLNTSQTYTVRAIDNCGTGVTVSKSFAPYAVVLKLIGSSCLNTALTLSVDTLATATYSWTKNGTSLTDSTNTYNIPNVTIADYGTYQVTVSVAGCNSFTGSQMVNASSCIMLPVQLISFTAKVTGTKSRLNWITATEENNLGFAIERSADGINWTQIDFVSSEGISNNSAQQLTYTWFDNTPLDGINYYRLKQVNTNGQTNYSVVQTLSFDIGKVNILPNPAGDVANVTGAKPGTILRLVDVTGRVMMQKQVANSIEALQLSQLSPAIYLLQVVENGLVVQTIKVMKK